MRLLVDTHALVWAMVEPAKLSHRIRGALEDGANEVLVSAAVAYEIEFKRNRDPELQRMPPNLIAAIPIAGFDWLDLTADHFAEAGKLPRHHGDPFDRLMIAQAFAEQATVVTIDRWFPTYGIPTIW